MSDTPNILPNTGMCLLTKITSIMATNHSQPLFQQENICTALSRDNK